MDHAVVANLPDDVLADILGRLAPRCLAMSRCVCKSWLAVVDARRLLRADLLPLSLGGLFIQLDGHPLPEFLSNPNSPSPINGALDFLPTAALPPNTWDWKDTLCVIGHFNGLLLLNGYVVNPATRRWDPLPVAPRQGAMPILSGDFLFTEAHLAYDPTMSPHYEVLSVPWVGGGYTTSQDHHYQHHPSPAEEYEWPPRAFKMQVFSSRTGCWGETSFLRQGDAVGTVFNMRPNVKHAYSIYQRGVLYVHWQFHFVLRISLSDRKYHVIKEPEGIAYDKYLGKSDKGVYYASFTHYWRLKVWTLDQGSMTWILKHNGDLKSLLAHHQLPEGQTSWLLQDINYNFFRTRPPIEWNSDHDGRHMAIEQPYEYSFEILGFDPFQETVFLSISRDDKTLETGLAYDLISSQVQVLGNLYPTHYRDHFNDCLSNEFWYFESFPYTPCWVKEFGGNQSN
ncbi:hypothetical protein BRADI_1g28737v3 [Brachypodium distachyon]|uniref:F-box domain-containing protein n=1 Tax=Brachypodium distachyon TaxID=15368 RepID=I1GUS9_BRADI|nr:hypothetical protein BRADI_1g28737v3 [Brachypodium distachyon]